MPKHKLLNCSIDKLFKAKKQSNNLTIQQSSSGFTLIELLVVISIIGILAAFIVASFTSAQQKARDSRRKADLDAVKKALELAKNDISGNYYPGCNPAAASCAPSATLPLLATAYIKAVPTDPNGITVNYIYAPTPGSCTSASCTAYSLTACIENTNDSQKDSSTNAGCTATTNVSYTITNP